MTFDKILVGAGPCAVAALSAQRPGQKILVITGAAPQLSPAQARGIHAKITSTAREGREEIGIGQRIPFAAPAKGELLRPAIVGGLANYWGQQFARYEANDPWPAGAFDSHAQYLEACGRIEELFHCSPGAAAQDAVTLGSGYSCRTPNLVVGSAAGRQLGLRSMRDAFQAQAAAQGAAVVDLAAVRWEVRGDLVRVVLSDGTEAEGRRLLLAAGVVGTLNLVFASCREVISATFDDHAPSMLYTTLRGRTLPTARADGEKHFNALAIERIVNGGVTLFASVYRLGHAPLSLLLAMLKLPPFSRGYKIPSLMNIITPIQVWTHATQMRYRLERGSATAFMEHAPDGATDTEMLAFLAWIKQHAHVWKVAAPAPGGGFHFCAARVRGTGWQEELPLDEWLAQSQHGKVVAVDASVLPELGCRPSALTMMANSRRIVQRLEALPNGG